MIMHNLFDEQRYYAFALDPVHVGAGGYRLGRVDLSIVREPGDQLPKIPGSSLSGAARAFTALQTGHVDCAGKGGDAGQKHCCRPDCPVCVAFGFSNGQTKQSLQGMAQFFDARILFSPVHSMVGPVWVTSRAVLAQAGAKEPPTTSAGKVRLADSLLSVGSGQALKHLNLRWLLLEAGEELVAGAIDLPCWPKPAPAWLQEVLSRLVLVPDDLFSRVVNDNLEVRTSVAIDPATGAADDKALFTYEAMPRSSVLYFDVVYNNPQHFQVDGKAIPQTAAEVKANVQLGLALFEHLGVGGMNTRGLGRLAVLGQEV